MPTEEGAGFAARTGCLFVEASAKTAVGVTEAFSDVVARIIDTPSLWREEKTKGSSAGAAGAGSAKAKATTTTVAVAAASGPRGRAGSMPGNIDLSQVQDEEAFGGCSC